MQLCGRRLSWTLTALLLLMSGVALAAQPKASTERYHLTIDRGSLKAVLEQFTRQTGLQAGTQLNVSESETDELGPFVGLATADEAMTALLKDTDLSYTWQDEYTIRIFATVVRPPRAEDDVQEVLVTGTRLRGDEDGPAPIRAYGHSRIDRYGVSSVSDLSRYLTQQPFSFGAGYLQSGAQFIQLRGLGFDTTLVLINGRRVPPSANSISLNAFDMNSIPLTAVERVEVMSDSASAIYGADAIGGVVNIILKKKVKDPEFYLHYGEADGGGTQHRAAASFGIARENLQGALVFDYYQQGALMGEKRDLWRNQDYRRFGGQDYRVSTTNPGNVYSLTALPLPGLSHSRAAIPSGTTPSRLTPADFLGTQGAINLQSPFSAWSAAPESRRVSGYGSMEYSSSPRLTVFGELLGAQAEVTALRALPALTREIVPASNPFNPFGVPVAVDYSFVGMDPTSYTFDTDLMRLVLGAKGAIGELDWEIAGLRSEENGSSTALGGIDRSRVAAALASTDPATSLNLFSDGPAGNSKLLDSLLGAPQSFSFSSTTSQMSAFATGPMFSVGGRNAEFVLGGEWRHDAAHFFESKPLDVDRDVAAAFAEIRVPLWDDLSMKVAVRGDDYTDGKKIINPQYGLMWKPAEGWLLRAAYGTSFRPPSLFELHIPLARVSMPIADPFRGGEVYSVGILVGGNPDLDVVTARSFTAGFVFNPPEKPGLRVGGSYWRVVMDNRIMVPLYQQLLRSEDQFPGRVVRDPASSQDLQAGWAGRLHSMDLTRANYGSLETSGIDLDASFVVERKRGALQVDMALTWVDKFLSRDMNQALPLDRVGIANVQGTVPEWRAVGTVTWKFSNFGLSTTASATPSYQDVEPITIGPLDRRIGSRVLVDFQAWADLALEGESLFDGTRFTLGARNIFDEEAQFAQAGGPSGYDYSQSELTQRFMYVRFSKRF